MKEENQVLPLQAKGHQRFPGNHQKLGKTHGIDSPPVPSDGAIPADPMITDFVEATQWLSVTAALAN